MVLSLKARLFLVEQVTKSSGGYTESVQQQFAEEFPGIQVPHRNTVRQLIAKARETGSVADAPRSGRPPVLTDKKIRDISEHKLQNPTKSIRKISQQLGISSSSAHRALKIKSQSHLQSSQPAQYQLRSVTKINQSGVKMKTGPCIEHSSHVSKKMRK